MAPKITEPVFGAHTPNSVTKRSILVVGRKSHSHTTDRPHSIVLVDSHDTGAYALLGPMTYGGPPRGSHTERGVKSKERVSISDSRPPPKSDSSGGMAPRCSNRLRANSSYLTGRTPTMAILSMSESVSTFDSANLQQTQELFCVFLDIRPVGRAAAQILLFSARNLAQTEAGGIRTRRHRCPASKSRSEPVSQGGFILSYTLFFLLYQPKSPPFLVGNTKSANLDFPAKFPWLLPTIRSDNQPSGSFAPPVTCGVALVRPFPNRRVPEDPPLVAYCGLHIHGSSG